MILKEEIINYNIFLKIKEMDEIHAQQYGLCQAEGEIDPRRERGNMVLRGGGDYKRYTYLCM